MQSRRRQRRRPAACRARSDLSLPPRCARRYEGEFDTGYAHGMGQYTSTKGKVYRGEWTTGQRNGCAATVRRGGGTASMRVQPRPVLLLCWCCWHRPCPVRKRLVGCPERRPPPPPCHTHTPCPAPHPGPAGAVWSTTPRPSSSAWRQGWTPTRCAQQAQQGLAVAAAAQLRPCWLRGRALRGCRAAGARHRSARARRPATQAWKEAQPEIEKSKRHGTWLRDTFFTGPDSSGRWCHIAEIKCVRRAAGGAASHWGCRAARHAARWPDPRRPRPPIPLPPASAHPPLQTAGAWKRRCLRW